MFALLAAGVVVEEELLVLIAGELPAIDKECKEAGGQNGPKGKKYRVHASLHPLTWGLRSCGLHDEAYAFRGMMHEVFRARVLLKDRVDEVSGGGHAR